jgi:hypothetical protein
MSGAVQVRKVSVVDRGEVVRSQQWSFERWMDSMNQQIVGVELAMRQLRERTLMGHLNVLYLEVWSRKPRSTATEKFDPLDHLCSMVWRRRVGQRATVSRVGYERMVSGALPEIERWYRSCDCEAQLLNAIAKNLRDSVVTMRTAINGTGSEGLKRMPLLLSRIEGSTNDAAIGFLRSGW